MFINSLSGVFTRTIMDSDNYYVVGSSGFIAIRISNNQEIGYVTQSGGFTDVWTDDESPFVYLSHSGNGVYKIEKVEISGNSTSKVFEFWNGLSSKSVLCLDGYGNDVLVAGTISGVDIMSVSGTFKGSGYSPVTSVAYLREKDYLYYSGSFGLVRKRGSHLANWSSLDVDYVLNSGTLPALPSGTINSIDVIDTPKGALLGVATNSGCMVILENNNYVKASSFYRLSSGG